MARSLELVAGFFTGLSLVLLVRALSYPAIHTEEGCLLPPESIPEQKSPTYEAQNRLGAGAVLSVSFSPNGKWIAAADYAAGQDRGLRLWEVSTGTSRLLVPGVVTSAAFSPDGKWIAYAKGDALSLFEVSSGMLRYVGALRGVPIYSVDFSRDGRWIVTGHRNGAVYVWNVKSGEAKYLGGSSQGDTDTVVFSPKGRLVASGGDDRTVWLRDARTGKSWKLGVHAGDEVFGLAFSPNGEWLVSAASNDTSTPCLWKVAERKGRCFTNARSGKSPYAAAFSPDGRSFALAWSDGAVTLHGVKDGSARDLIQAKEAIYSVSFSPNGRQIATGGADGQVRLWDARSGKEISLASP